MLILKMSRLCKQGRRSKTRFTRVISKYWKVYKIEMGLASSIFELNPPKFQNYYNFGKCYNFRAGPIKQAGRNFWKILKIEQVLIRMSRLENEQNVLLRACSLNRHTRVGWYAIFVTIEV